MMAGRGLDKYYNLLPEVERDADWLKRQQKGAALGPRGGGRIHEPSAAPTIILQGKSLKR